MKYILTSEEYNDLKSRAIPEDKFEQLRQEMILASQIAGRALGDCIQTSLPDDLTECKIRVFSHFEATIRRLTFPNPDWDKYISTVIQPVKDKAFLEGQMQQSQEMLESFKETFLKGTETMPESDPCKYTAKETDDAATNYMSSTSCEKWGGASQPPGSFP